MEYAVRRPPLLAAGPPRFSNHRITFGGKLWVDAGGAPDGASAIDVTSVVTTQDFQALASASNASRQRDKDDKLREAAAVIDSPQLQKELYDAAALVQSLRSYASGRVYAAVDEGRVPLQALIGDHVVFATRRLEVSPEQTARAFLHNFRARAPFETPSGAGVCLPFLFATDEMTPATIGVSMRLQERPDLWVHVLDEPTKGNARAELKEFESTALARSTHFLGAVSVSTLDKFTNGFRAFDLDRRRGLGVFVVVTRRDDDADDEAVNNSAEGNRDWGFVGYVPGDPSAPPGRSSDLTLRVERFGRFASKPMSEAEFRSIVETIAKSIIRRPDSYRKR